MRDPSLTKIIAAASCLLLTGLGVPSAQAQNYGGYSGSTTGTGTGIAPLFILPDFEGDARAGDLYEYLHFQPQQPWNSYQLLVQEIMMQDQQNINTPPSLATAGAYGPMAATTSVTGTVLPSGYASAPGLASH